MAEEEKLRRPVRLTDELARIIGERIASGSFAAGEPIPSEKDLGEAFGVSRAVVREAISRLKHEGLIETRQGARAYVSPNPSAQIFRLESVGDIDLVALFELRICVESRAAAMAATHRHNEDLAQMIRHLAVMASPGGENDDKVAADVAFHAAIAAATDNSYFARFIEFLGGPFRTAIGAARINSARLDGMSAQVQGEHDAIYQAIARADPDRAALAMTRHLTNARDRLGLAASRP